MSTKSSLSFKPAPRPQPRVTPEEARRLQEGTRDLGFGRPTAAPTEPPADTHAGAASEAETTGAGEARAPAVPAAPATAAQTSTPTRVRAASSSSAKPAVASEARGPALKFDVPDALWTELRQEALNRRVTVRYLVLEALAAKGYRVDLEAIPEDGRRIR